MIQRQPLISSALLQPLLQPWLSCPIIQFPLLHFLEWEQKLRRNQQHEQSPADFEEIESIDSELKITLLCNKADGLWRSRFEIFDYYCLFFRKNEKLKIPLDKRFPQVGIRNLVSSIQATILLSSKLMLQRKVSLINAVRLLLKHKIHPFFAQPCSHIVLDMLQTKEIVVENLLHFFLLTFSKLFAKDICREYHRTERNIVCRTSYLSLIAGWFCITVISSNLFCIIIYTG